MRDIQSTAPEPPIVSKVRREFASEYHELMWLADKIKHSSLSEEEQLRFYELRDKWPEMHGDSGIGDE